MGAVSDTLLAFCEMVYPNDEHRQNLLMADIMSQDCGPPVSTLDEFRRAYEKTGYPPQMGLDTMQKLVSETI